jgi:hypothetical protein
MQNKSSLIITGGWAHDFDGSVPALVELLRGINFDVDVAWDVADSGTLMQQKNYELIVAYACWFQMKDDRYSDEQRSVWARSTSSEWKAALQKQQAGGAGLLALHTSVICFDDAPDWAQWVGGSWAWGVSNHPQPSDVQVVCVATHPIVDGVKPFVVHDEQYMQVDRNGETTVLTETIGIDGNHASMWVRGERGARSVYSALGHDQRSLVQPTHQQLLRRAALWAIGASDEEIRGVSL